MHNDKARWIWFPGDFEVWLGNRFNNRRTERGTMFPPFWKQDSHYVTVEFSTTVVLEKAETIDIFAEGDFHFMLDGRLQFGQPRHAEIPVGRHRLNFKVWNQSSPPALLICGPTVATNSRTWLATYEDKIWIDENGVAHGAGVYVPAASWRFARPDEPPSRFRLPRQRQDAVKTETLPDGILYDFGRETFGYPVLHGLRGEGVVALYYGESAEEALDKDHCETLDRIGLCHGKVVDEARAACDAPTYDGPVASYVLHESKAFRYVYLVAEGNARCQGLSLDYEYAHREDETGSGYFRCNDDEIDQIWRVSAYTLDLTTREFFMDGIKRDRWTWSGDAVQSYLMNYYLRFDTDCVRRTIRQLRGKDPVTAHVNTIMDYTFYWFRSVADFYLYTGDTPFLREIYPRMTTLMDYCLSRTRPDGMMEGQADDWIFVDWVDFPMRKRGALCFEQILFYESLRTMSQCASILRDHPDPCPPQGSIGTERYAEDARKYDEMAKKLRQSTLSAFWDGDAHALLHAIDHGETDRSVTKFPNMFALLYDFVDEDTQRDILQHVLLSPGVEPITTPYMRFYELEALCRMGLQADVLSQMKAYWGGMLREGATTFWEKYNPAEHGTQHLSMYGRPYGKSLCHAWGAAPVYLLGRYFLGVRPLSPGYATYEVRPAPGGLTWMEGDVPTPFGLIHVRVDDQRVSVRSDGGRGKLVWNGRSSDIPANQEISIDR